MKYADYTIDLSIAKLAEVSITIFPYLHIVLLSGVKITGDASNGGKGDVRMKKWFRRWGSLWTPFVMKLLVIMFFIEFIKGALLVSVLPVYFHSVLGLSAFVLGWAFALQYVGDNVFRGPVGWMIDKWGYRTTMSIGLALTCVAVMLIGFVHSAPWLIVGCFLLGAGTSPLWPCVVTGTTEVAGDAASGTVLSAVYAAWMAGTGAGPTIINLFVQGVNMTLAFEILIAFSGLALLIALFLPRDSLPGKERKRADRILGKKTSILATLGSIPAGSLLYPAMFLQTFALGVLTPIVTLFAREDLGVSPKEFSLLLIIGGAATLLLLIPVGRWTDRFGTARFLRLGIPLSAAATVSFAFVKEGPQLIMAVIAVGLGYALVIPAWNALLAKAIPKEGRGAVWGAFLTIEGAGFVAGPILSGWLWDEVSHSAPFMLSGAVLSVFFILHLFISLRKSDVLR
jgi:DHA1 family multidrug resistance protein-like MFS transporter